MQVERRHDFDVSARELVDAMTSREFFRFRFSLSGVDDFRFDAFEQTDAGFLIRVLRDMEISGGNVPVFARKFLGQTYTLVQEFLWTSLEQSPYRAEYHFYLGNIPVQVKGGIEITERNGRAHQCYRVHVSSSVPVVGRKLVNLVGERVEKALDSDYRGTLRFLEHQGLIG
jgi:hypothetical protein